MAVTVTTGKTHTRFSRLILGGTNLSGDARSLGGVGVTFDNDEAQGWDAGIKQFLVGQATIQCGPFQAVFSNTAAANGVEAGSHVAIPAVIGTADTIVTVALGIREAPTIGAPAFSHQCQPKDYVAGPVANGTTVVSADFSSANTGQYKGAVRWGQLLAVGASVSSSSDLGSLDNGASSANGAIAVLHVTRSVGAMGSNSWTIKIQHSSNDSSFSDLLTFSANGTAVTSEWDETSATGTVNRYTRVRFTKSAGTDIVAWVNLIRL